MLYLGKRDDEDVDVVSVDMTSVPSYHVRGTHIDRDGEDGTAVDSHVNFGLVNHHRHSYRDVAANVKDTSGPDGINDDILYRDSPAAATEDESAAMRLNNLRSGRKHGAFRAWESHDGPHHHPHHRHLNQPPPLYPSDQPVPNASVIRMTKENVHHSNPSTSRHLPYTCKSNKHSKKRSSSHFGPEERSVKRSPSPEPSTSGSQSNHHEHIHKHNHHIKSNKHAHNRHSKSSSHSVPPLDRIAKQPTSVSAAAYHPEVPYVDSDDNVETSDSDVDVMNSPPPGECCYTSTEELWQGAPPALPPPAPPPPPPAHSGAHHHHHGQYDAYARSRSAHFTVRPKHGSPRDSYTTDGATDRSCRFHQRSAEDMNLDRNAVRRQYADPYDQHLLSGAYGAIAAQQLTNAAERELFASGGFHSAAVNLSTKETNSDDSDIEVVSIIETKKPRLRSSKRGRSATVVVDLTESDTEAGPSATQSRPGDSVAEGDLVIHINNADEEDSQDAVQIAPHQPGRSDPLLDTEAGPSATQSRPADDDAYVSLPEAEARVGSTSQANISQSRAESRPPFHHIPPSPPSYSETMYQQMYNNGRHHSDQRRSCCHAQKDTSSSCSHSFGRPAERGDKHVQESYDRHAHSARHHPHSQRSYRRSSEYYIQLFF